MRFGPLKLCGRVVMGQESQSLSLLVFGEGDWLGSSAGRGWRVDLNERFGVVVGLIVGWLIDL